MGSLDFSWALIALKNGAALTRKGWNGKGMWVSIQYPDAQSANSLPYFYIVTAGGARVPWAPSQTDLLAQDWCFADAATMVQDNQEEGRVLTATQVKELRKMYPKHFKK